MSVAPTSTYVPTIDKIVKRAMIRTGLVDATEDLSAVHIASDVQNCREHLQEVLTALMAENVQMRFLEFQNVQLVAGTSEYALSATALDVLGDGMYIEAGDDVTAATGETVVKQVEMDFWHRLSTKSASGRPTQMFVYREGTPVTLRLWPTPDEAGVVRIQVHRQPADSVYGQYDVDLEPYWHSYLTFRVAVLYALDKGEDQKAMLLQASAQIELDKAKAKSQERPAGQGHVEHNTGWRR